jgi:hypothetical protein
VVGDLPLTFETMSLTVDPALTMFASAVDPAGPATEVRR